MRPEITDIGDWRARHAQIASEAPRDVVGQSLRRLPGGVAKKLSRCVEWYGEDWCGISTPRP